jgi:myo-inositol-1(or 4)-monophosphatase
MSSPSPLADIELVKRLVADCGKAALERCGTVECEFKADRSIVTAVDRDTEEKISSVLLREYPDFAFVGEEFGWQGDPSQPTWAVDPIDGTTNYFYGLPFWGVSVGLLSNGVAEMGAIYFPRFDELFWGVSGGGAFCNGIRIQAEDRDELYVEDTICLTSNSLKTLNSDAVAGRIRALGSIAAELVYTARGNLTATVGLYEGIVDMAAAFCICAEAGCKVAYLDRSSLDIAALTRDGRTRKHFVVSPPRLLNHLQRILYVR